MKDERRRRGDAAILVMAFVVTLGVQVPFASLPFDEGFAAVINGRFEGLIQRHWHADGFLRMRGRPIIDAIPTEPASGLTYGNHPPLVHWLVFAWTKTFGLREWSLRATGILCTAVTATLLAALAIRFLGRVGGLVATAAFATSPMVRFFGSMAGFESPLLLVMSATVFVTLTGNGRRRAAFFPLLLVAAWIDWAAVFVLPALLITAPRGFRLKAAVSGGAILGVGFVTYLILLASWEGGFAAAWTILTSAGASSQNVSGIRWASVAVNQFRFITDLYGPVGAAALALGSVIAAIRFVRGRADPIDKVIVSFFTVALLNVAVFPGRSLYHEFWSYYALPALALSIAKLVAMRPRVLAILLIVAAITSGWPAAIERHERETRGRAATLAAMVNSHHDADTILFVPSNWASRAWVFYADAWVVGFGTEIAFIDAIDRFRAGELRGDRLAAWYPREFDVYRPELLAAITAKGAVHSVSGSTSLLVIER